MTQENGVHRSGRAEKIGREWKDRYFVAVFLAPLERLRNNRNALLEDVAHHQGGQRRQAGAGSTGSRYNLGAAGGDANFCWAQRLRRFEEDESAAAVAGELRLDGNHCGPAVPRVEWLHTYIPNWGWSIVVLTLIANMLLFPLRISSYKTTMKMQRVGPEIKAIQEKYKKYKINDRAS